MEAYGTVGYHMKRTGFLLIFILAALLLFGCSQKEEPLPVVTADEPKETETVKELETGSEQTEAAEAFDIAMKGDFPDLKLPAADVQPEESFRAGDVCDFEEEGNAFLSAAGSPYLELGGIKKPSENGGEFFRLDAGKKEDYSDLNSIFAVSTAGGTVRFRTDAEKIIIKAELRNTIAGYHHISDRGAYGFDAYIGTGQDRQYLGGRMQFMTDEPSMEEEIELPGGFQEIMIDLPQYSGISELYIGFPADAMVAEPLERTYGPILFYGSSITQGACASRPGTSYTNTVCRKLDCDCINLGFSESALGEQSVAEYICTREISAFVMDYDNNAETAKQLADTHYDFYKTVREGHPDVPIIMLTRPYFLPELSDEEAERQKVVFDTYTKAKAEGDENVYFISADDIFPSEDRDAYTVDKVHPNDLGHYMMAKKTAEVIYRALNEQ